VQTSHQIISFEGFESLLSSAERDRASRFKFEKDRRRYVITHGALRSILSGYLTCPAQELEFASGPYGKPQLAAFYSKSKIDFNLSHSHEVALIAVTEAREIGVDVEWVRKDFAFGEVAERFFTRREVAALHSLPHHFQREAFYKCWTSKEAFLKAKATGLSGELDEVEIKFSLEEGVRVNGAIPNWTLVELNPCDGYVGAFAVQGPEPRLKCFQWQQSLRNRPPE
jgi:4'-phosphopantetheinyl transferase